MIDLHGILVRYVKLEEKMKLLWDAEMRVNTVRPVLVFYGLWAFRISYLIAVLALAGSRLRCMPSAVARYDCRKRRRDLQFGGQERHQ